jgi:hypothetical protein
MERFGKVGQPMRLTAIDYFSPPLGTSSLQCRCYAPLPSTLRFATRDQRSPFGWLLPTELLGRRDMG